MGLIQPVFAHGGFLFEGFVNPFVNGWTFHATENLSECPMQVGGTIRNMKVRLPTAPGVGTSRTFTFRKNGSNQSVTVTIGGTDTEGADTSNSFTFAAGDKITCQHAISGSPANSGSIQAVCEVESDDTATSVYGFGINGSSNPLDNTGTSYIALFSGSATGAGLGTYNVAAIEGSVPGWRLELSTPSGSGITRTFTLEKNGVLQDGSGGTPNTTIAIAGASDVAGSTSFSLDISPLDLIRVAHTVSGGTASNSTVHGSVAVVADTPGQSMWCGSPNTNPSNAQYNFVFVGGGFAWDSTEANREQIGPVTTIELSGLYVSLVAAPGVGTSLTHTLRKNQSSTAQTVTVADTNTTGGPSGGAVVELGTSDRFAMLATISGAVNVTPRWAFLMTDPSIGPPVGVRSLLAFWMGGAAIAPLVAGQSGFNPLLVAP